MGLHNEAPNPAPRARCTAPTGWNNGLREDGRQLRGPTQPSSVGYLAPEPPLGVHSETNHQTVERTVIDGPLHCPKALSSKDLTSITASPHQRRQRPKGETKDQSDSPTGALG